MGLTFLVSGTWGGMRQVLEARFEDSRLEKERAAILSEMSMVNTMDYRVGHIGLGYA